MGRSNKKGPRWRASNQTRGGAEELDSRGDPVRAQPRPQSFADNNANNAQQTLDRTVLGARGGAQCFPDVIAGAKTHIDLDILGRWHFSLQTAKNPQALRLRVALSPEHIDLIAFFDSCQASLLSIFLSKTTDLGKIQKFFFRTETLPENMGRPK
jgi:hypothetical protein